ncbi:hypothetical protein ACHAQJ_006633 [Trichoderma viride]
MKISRFLRRLLGEDSQNNDAAILQLPLDIVLLIVDCLALHDKFLLSQSCKTFRRTVLYDWEAEISNLSLRDELRFWAGLAYIFPSHWACPKCRKLHRIHFSELPTVSIPKLRRTLCGTDLSRGRFTENGYSIQYYHIQFALKLSRLGNVNQQYLAALMKTYTHTTTSSMEPLTKSYTAEPKILNKRFILREEWNVSNILNSSYSLIQDNRLRIPLCPHLRIICGGLSFSRKCKRVFARLAGAMDAVTRLEDGVESALECPGQWKYISCPRCPTDCDIRISADLTFATIRAWHDFGIEGSPMDIGWRAHVETRSYKDWLEQGPRLDYPHGSIRKLWLADISDETGIHK